MSPGWKLRLCGTILSWLVLATAEAQELPIFDVHIHYSRPDWQVFTPERILIAMLNASLASPRKCLPNPYAIYG